MAPSVLCVEAEHCITKAALHVHHEGKLKQQQ